MLKYIIKRLLFLIPVLLVVSLLVYFFMSLTGDPVATISGENLTEAQRANRRLLREVMLSQGFLPLASEWWHFHLAEEPYPHVCFDFPIDASTVHRLETALPQILPGFPKKWD